MFYKSKNHVNSLHMAASPKIVKSSISKIRSTYYKMISIMMEEERDSYVGNHVGEGFSDLMAEEISYCRFTTKSLVSFKRII